MSSRNSVVNQHLFVGLKLDIVVTNATTIFGVSCEINTVCQRTNKRPRLLKNRRTLCDWLTVKKSLGKERAFVATETLCLESFVEK